MKTKRVYRIVIVLAIIAVSLIFFLSRNGRSSQAQSENKKNMESNSKPVYSGNSKRQNITFILGEDKKESTPYYSLALDYYSNDKFARTEYINNSCRSLSEVRDYLRNNPPGNGLPWGIVNLISHGNEWYGMSVPVAPGSKRSSTERITEYVNDGKFPKPLAEKTNSQYLGHRN